jgi:uncharacterized repeat protein (TIGR03806 family)
MRAFLAAAACLALALGVSASGNNGTAVPNMTASSSYPTRLSEFGFFNGSADKPNPVLIPYTLKTPLFSDYAEKQRFVFLPLNKKVSVDKADGRMIFPDGTVLIKNFGYPDAKGKLKVLETRLLIRLPDQWLALPYVWRPDGKDAELKLAGARIPVNTKLADGRKINISYAVPNKNQCKECHSEADAVVPIGPRVGNMVIDGHVAHDKPLLSAIEGQFGGFAWDTAVTSPLDQRARAYLAINCAHCHNAKGSASNSGLYLGRDVNDPITLGLRKRPVAAGRAAGNFEFVIDPGHPERSILIHRLKSTDPGIAMPELGRATVHAEGLKLLEDWIRAMEPQS